jgi:hypothetical protein
MLVLVDYSIVTLFMRIKICSYHVFLFAAFNNCDSNTTANSHFCIFRIGWFFSFEKLIMRCHA